MHTRVACYYGSIIPLQPVPTPSGSLHGVETDLSDQKNGTSAENGGTCAPYPIIREPELCLPYD